MLLQMAFHELVFYSLMNVNTMYGGLFVQDKKREKGMKWNKHKGNSILPTHVVWEYIDALDTSQLNNFA